MLDFIFNTCGFLMFVWYSMGLRYLVCKNEPWLYNPINFLTAFISAFFIIFSFFHYPELDIGALIFYLALFVWGRNAFYIIEDIIDYVNSPSPKQLTYVILDAIMIIYSSICLLKVV